MGILDLFKKNNNEVKINLMSDDTSSGMVDGEASASTTVSITEDTVVKVAALNQGINIISDTIASMPIYLHKDNSGFQETLFDDSRSRILSGMANEVLTSFNLKHNLIKDLILYGNAYAKIERNGDEVDLIYLPNSVVTPKCDNNGIFFEVKSYQTDVQGEKFKAEVVDYYDMLVLIKNAKYNSITGVGLLEQASEVLTMAIQESNYMNNIFANGLSTKALITSKTPFKREVKEQLKSDLKDLYSGAAAAGKTMVLEGDISVVPLSLTPTDVKLLEQKKLTITDIARFLNIPKHMLNLDRSQGTYSNIIQERLQLLTNTLTPFTVAIEEAFNQKLLTEEEQKDGYYFKFDTQELLRLSPSDNADYMLKLYKEKIVTLEEVRASLNLGGDIEIIEELKKYQELSRKSFEDEVNKDIESDSNSEEVKVEEKDISKEKVPSEKEVKEN